MSDSAGDYRPEPGVAAPSPGLTYRDLRRTVFLVFGLIVVFHLAEPLSTLLLFFLLVFILAAVLNPLAVRLERRRIPRIATAIGVVLVLLGLLTLLGAIVFPSLANELGDYLSQVPAGSNPLMEWYLKFRTDHPELADMLPDQQQIQKNLGGMVTGMIGRVGKYALNVVAGVFSLFLLMVLVIYTVGHPRPLVTGLLAATPASHRPTVETALRRILEQLKNWAFGSMVLGVIVGLMTAVGLWLLGKITGQPFPYLLLFSVIAGIGELIPNIGPLLSAVPPVLVALTIDPWLALWVVVLFIIIQQLENNLIVPVVMGQSLNLHPVSVTFAVLVMGALFGLLGAVMAVPVCAITKVIWEEFYLRPRQPDSAALEALADHILSSGSPNPRDEAPLTDENVMDLDEEEPNGPASPQRHGDTEKA
jgi:putative permease